MKIRKLAAIVTTVAISVIGLVGSVWADEPQGVKMLFLGNSITRHPPYPSIGWTNDWGMAATAMSNDYVHVLAEMYGEKVGKTPDIRVRNIATFEQNWNTYDLNNDAVSRFGVYDVKVLTLSGRKVMSSNCPRTDGNLV